MASFLGEWNEKRIGIITEHGYRAVSLYDGSGDKPRTKRRMLHVLVAECFLGPRPVGMQCCHNDGNPKNIWLDNLRWDTPAGNARDKRLHGTARVGVGERHARAILTDELVLRMKALRYKGLSYKAIGEMLGYSSSCTLKAVTGRTWKHVREPAEDEIECLTSGL